MRSVAPRRTTRSYTATLTGVDVQANGPARDLETILEVLADEMRRPALRKYLYADRLHVVVAGDLDALPD